MNPQIKQKWLSALRSGDYQQTQGRLRKEDKFCCLGVLCDLYGKENNVEWEINEDSGKYMYEKHFTVLPPSVIGWAGVGVQNPNINAKRTTTTLASLNDNGYTFNEISDVIEEHL
jgi:hypothetical protein